MALFLVALVITTFTYSTGAFSPHQKLVNTLDDLERAVRFSSDEAVLRNRIVRLLVTFGAEGQSFTVEYSNEADFVLPTQYLVDSEASDFLNNEELQAKRKEIENQFSKVEEFQEEPIEISDMVQVLGVGSTLDDTLVLERQANVFFYPSGEKDGAIFIIGNEQEIATLTIEPFTTEMRREFYSIEGDQGDLFAFQIEKAKELFEEWLGQKR